MFPLSLTAEVAMTAPESSVPEAPSPTPAPSGSAQPGTTARQLQRGGSPQTRFIEAYQAYLGALDDLSWEMQISAAEQHRKYTQELCGVEREGQRKHGEAVDEYARKIRDAGEDDERGRAEAHRAFVRTAEETWHDTVRRAGEVSERFADAERQACEDARKRAERAYADYVQSVQKEWAQLRAGAVEPAALAVIGQTVISAAACAQNTLPMGPGSRS
jgi:hypothetical protein